MRTLKRENVRLDLKVIRLAIKNGRFKRDNLCILAKMQFL
jgi:hypothetical protein